MNAVRQQRIVALLRKRGAVAAGELQALLGVTAMTVWRDLRDLEEQGLLRRVWGGAQTTEANPGEMDFETKAPAEGDVLPVF